MNCGLIDVPCHLNSWFFGLLNMVPWWAWVVLGLILVGIVWRIAGWWGIVALATVAGFILGRRERPDPDYETGEPEKPWPNPRWNWPDGTRKTPKRILTEGGPDEYPPKPPESLSSGH